MLISQVLLQMALYASMILVAPGPTNTLLLSSGIDNGFRSSWYLVIAETLGYVIAISIWGSFLVSLATANPWLLDVVRLFCSAYIFYLATRLWKSTNFGKNLNKPIGFRDLFIATMLNPKALLFASAIFPPLAFVSLEFFCLSMLVFIAMTLSIGSGWLAMGGILRSNRSWGVHTPKLMRGASLVLVMFSGTLMFSVLSR